MFSSVSSKNYYSCRKLTGFFRQLIQTEHLLETFHSNLHSKLQFWKNSSLHYHTLKTALICQNCPVFWSAGTNKWKMCICILTQKVNNGNTKTMCEICSKLTIKAPERPQWRCSGVFIVNFEQLNAGWGLLWMYVFVNKTLAVGTYQSFFLVYIYVIYTSCYIFLPIYLSVSIYLSIDLSIYIYLSIIIWFWLFDLCIKQKQSPEVFCKKKVFLEISQNPQENTCARVSFLIKLQAVLQNTSRRLLLYLTNITTQEMVPGIPGFLGPP